MNKANKFITEWVAPFVMALLVFLVINVFVGVNRVYGESMAPNYHSGEFAILNKFFYTEPQRGDVVVFKSEIPDNSSLFGSNKRLIKRVIALPGENIGIKDGKVYVNGRELEEEYLPEGLYTEGDISYDIPEGYYWCMGDNRPNSADSRVLGPISFDDFIGQVVFTVF